LGVNTGYVTDGSPNEQYIEFYERRSSPLLHCGIVGNVVIPGGIGSNASTAIISDNPVWGALARSISGKGTIPGIQLTTAWEGYVGARSFRSKWPEAAIAEYREVVANMPSSQIKDQFDQLKRGTDLALSAGFRHIQLHAAHGYMFSLLIDPGIYERSEAVLEKLEAWGKYLKNQGAESSIRISLRTGLSSFDGDERKAFLDTISALPFTYIDVSSGFYNIDKQLIYPGRPEVIEKRRTETISLANRHPRRLFIYSGRALNQPEHNLPPNIHVGLCRDLIANPDFLNKMDWGCVNAGDCHYFSRGKPNLTCHQWRLGKKV